MKIAQAIILVLTQSIAIAALADKDASLCVDLREAQRNNCCEDQFRFDYSDSASRNIADCKGEEFYKSQGAEDSDIEEQVISALANTFRSEEQCHTDDLLDDAAFRGFGGCSKFDRDNGRCEFAKPVKGYGTVITICFGG